MFRKLADMHVELGQQNKKVYNVFFWTDSLLRSLSLDLTHKSSDSRRTLSDVRSLSDVAERSLMDALMEPFYIYFNDSVKSPQQ